MYKNTDEVKHYASKTFHFIIMNGRSSPVLLEFISVPICHGQSCPITGGRGFCPL